VKPANIMLMADGRVKLADFGVAHVPASSVTMTGMIVGSPKYLSPEQVLGRTVDGRADIFSLGVVLYEMLTGQTPFDSPDITVFTLMHRTVSDPAPPVSGLDESLPAAFDAILARALAKRPEQRYARARDFANDLRNYQRLALPRAADGDATIVSYDAARPLHTAVAEAVSFAHAPPKDEAREHNMAQLLQDIEAFSRRLDEQTANERENAARKPASDAALPQAARREATQPIEETKQKPTTRSELLDLLREQAQAKHGHRGPAPTLESVLALDARLRRAAQYFATFVAEFNRATPTFAGMLKLLYLRNVPALTLSRGFVDYRTRRHLDKEVMDYITLTYHMTGDTALRCDLNRDEARLLKAQLERAHWKYEEREVKVATGRVPRAALFVPCAIPASARLSGDYETLAVKFECRNVGLLGPARYRVEFARFDDATIEEFGKLVLGFSNQFSAFRYTH
jgi:hypothetical protein